MPALDRDCPNTMKSSVLVNCFNVNSGARNYALLHRLQKTMVGRMRRSARQFAGSACETFLYFTKYPSHSLFGSLLPPLSFPVARFRFPVLRCRISTGNGKRETGNDKFKLACSKDQGMHRAVAQQYCLKRPTTSFFRFHSSQPIPDFQGGSQHNRLRYQS